MAGAFHIRSASTARVGEAASTTRLREVDGSRVWTRVRTCASRVWHCMWLRRSRVQTCVRLRASQILRPPPPPPPSDRASLADGDCGERNETAGCYAAIITSRRATARGGLP